MWAFVRGLGVQIERIPFPISRSERFETTRPRARLKFVTRFALLISMSAVMLAQDLSFSIPPVKTSMDAGGQPVTIIAMGAISGNRQAVKLKLSADLSDLQTHITGLLQAQLNRSDRCGERLSVERAEIQPSAPAAALVTLVRYEKWTCVKALGKEITKRLVGGKALIPVRLTPVVNENREVRLTGEVGEVEADGALGEVLRSGSFGETLQERIRTPILAALNKGASLGAALPEGVAGIAKIKGAAFGDSGAGHLSFELEAEIVAPFDQIRAMIEHK